jgi:hypothetical protein
VAEWPNERELREASLQQQMEGFNTQLTLLRDAILAEHLRWVLRCIRWIEARRG